MGWWNADSSILAASSKHFSRKAKKRFLIVVLTQISLGFLDLIGVALIGVLSALAITGVESHKTGNRVNFALRLLRIQNLSFTQQAATLGIAAAIFLIGRTLFSILIIRRVYFFLARESARISARLVSFVLSKNLLEIQERTSQETLFAVTNGVTALTIGIIGSAVNIISDASLMLIVTIGLFVLDPITALGAGILFGFVAWILYQLTSRRAQELGSRDTKLQIQSNEKIIEVLATYRESVVKNRRGYYAEQIGQLRMSLANVIAEFAFMPNISKYVIESSVVLGGLVIGAVEFVLQDAVHAIATLTIFLAAGTRIAPAILRIQQSSIQIRGSAGIAAPTLALLSELGEKTFAKIDEGNFELNHVDFTPEISIKNLSFKYPNSSTNALTNVDMKITSGSFIAITGASGAGKTTLVDMILGLIEPDIGEVRISGNTPLNAFQRWPGAVGYVPQEVSIISGTIRDNVALGFPDQAHESELIWDALRLAQLDQFILSLPDGLDTVTGEKGSKLSGGQRQRLGIARAMFTKPKLLILDEATSALDAQTEAGVSEALQGMKGSTTVVMIAHRLSSVRNADEVIFLTQGAVSAHGTFEEVKLAIPHFAAQAKLLGL